ncbi:alpha/beta hydrolase [Azohydromonas aeria]|uniref:alpha/beta hydrolase n=1 Tax=Azohydromonas aeria TaxID=2590212 RepID=UPI0012F9ED48|nr:alpha/beta hydrolase [Azohydromonas aeria]
MTDAPRLLIVPGLRDSGPAHWQPWLRVASDTDRRMSAANALAWAMRWGLEAHDLGDAGHVNAEAGSGPWPLAQRWVDGAARRLARHERAGRAALQEWRLAL